MTETIYQTAFNDELEKIGFDFGDESFYFDEHAGDIKKYHKGKMTFGELKKKVAPEVAKAKRYAVQDLEAREAMSEVPLEKDERVLNAVLAGLGGGIGGGAAGGLIKGPRGALLGGLIAGLTTSVLGYSKKKHDKYTKSQLREDLKKVYEASKFTKSKLEDMKKAAAKASILKNVIRGENEIITKHLITELSKKGLTHKKKTYANR